MKIGILTLPLHINYGGILQAYALQKVLKNWGHEIETINYQFPKNKPSLRTRILRACSALKKSYKRYILKKPVKIDFTIIGDIKEYPNSDCEIKEFIHDNIILSPKITNHEMMESFAKEHPKDVWIVGSDQVWRNDYTPDIKDFFLGFLNQDSQSTRISYAASSGISKNYIYKEFLPDCKALLKRFHAISVREKSTIEAIKRDFGLDAVQVIDPTLLLDKSDYFEIIDSEDVPRQPSIVSYILDPDEQKESVIEHVKSAMNLKDQIRLSIDPHDNHGKLMSVSKWLGSISNAKMVITDSFHGCVFCLIFNRPFMAIVNHERGADRFRSLLEPLGLMDRIVTTPKKLPDKQIDYSKIQPRLSLLRQSSLKFLKNAIHA